MSPLCKQTLVFATILKGRVTASQLLSGYTIDLTTASIAPDGERTLSGIKLELNSNHISDSVIERLDAFNEETHAPYKVKLPEHERYQRVVGGDGHLFPFPRPVRSHASRTRSAERRVRDCLACRRSSTTPK